MMLHVPRDRKPSAGRRPSGRARAGAVTALLVAVLGTAVALLLTTAAPQPASLPAALEVTAADRGPAPVPPSTTSTSTTSTSTTTATTATTLRGGHQGGGATATTSPEDRKAGEHEGSGDGGRTTVVAPSAPVRIEDGAGHRIGGDH